MILRRGGRKKGYKKIAQSRVRASRKYSPSKKNARGTHNNNNPPIKDEIADVIAKILQDVDRQRSGDTDNITGRTESPTSIDHTPHHQLEGEHSVNDTNIESGAINSTQHDLHEEISQATPCLLGKRKRESNFVSRIEVGLQLNKASDPCPRENNIQSEVLQDPIGTNTKTKTATSKRKGRGKRGMYKSFVVDMKIKGKGSKLRVAIPDDIDRAIGENARHLVNECGRVVRTKAPFNVQNWKKAFEVAGDSMLKEIQEKFEIAQSGDYLRLFVFVEETMQRLYRLFKCRLHYHYKTCGKTDDERKKNPPPDVPQTQWEYLIKHFGSDEFKVVSARNSKNRKSDKRVKHTTGNLSFPESEEILTKKNGNVKPSADIVWLVQHTHNNDEGKLEWLSGDTRSKEIHANLKSVVATVGDSLTQEEILTQVLGQRCAYVRGKGIRVRGYAKEKAQAGQRKIVEQQQEKIQEQEQKIRELEETQLRQQREFEELQLKQREDFEAYKAEQQVEMLSFKQSILHLLLTRT